MEAFATPSIAAFFALVAKRAVPSELYGLVAAAAVAGSIMSAIAPVPLRDRTAARDVGVATALVVVPTAAARAAVALVQRTPDWAFGMAAAFAVGVAAARSSHRTRARSMPTVAGVYAAATFVYAASSSYPAALCVHACGLAGVAIAAAADIMDIPKINPNPAAVFATFVGLTGGVWSCYGAAQLWRAATAAIAGHLMSVVVGALWADPRAGPRVGPRSG